MADTARPAAVAVDEKNIDVVTPKAVSYLNQELALPWQDYVPILLLLSWSASCESSNVPMPAGSNDQAAIDVFSLPDLGVFVANNVSSSVSQRSELRPAHRPVIWFCYRSRLVSSCLCIRI